MIVGIVPTYREGPLATGAIKTLLKCCQSVIVFEGPIGEPSNHGYPTRLKNHKDPFEKDQRVIVKHGAWDTEVAKRNAMLEYTRRFPAPLWGVFLDGDELLIDAEYVPDLIWAGEVNNEAEEREVAVVPLLRTEVDGSVGTITRIVRVDLVERHVLSMSQWKFFSSDIAVTFPVLPVWRPGEPLTEEKRPPIPGEPHIYHRPYYRPPDRGEQRLYKGEIDDFRELERRELERLGIRSDHQMIPVNQDQGFIVARDTGEVQPPGSILDEIERSRKQL